MREVGRQGESGCGEMREVVASGGCTWREMFFQRVILRCETYNVSSGGDWDLTMLLDFQVFRLRGTSIFVTELT